VTHVGRTWIGDVVEGGEKGVQRGTGSKRAIPTQESIPARTAIPLKSGQIPNAISLFPTEEAATKLIYLANRNFEKGGSNFREWFTAKNQFAIMFEARFNA